MPIEVPCNHHGVRGQKWLIKLNPVKSGAGLSPFRLRANLVTNWHPDILKGLGVLSNIFSPLTSLGSRADVFFSFVFISVAWYFSWWNSQWKRSGWLVVDLWLWVICSKWNKSMHFLYDYLRWCQRWVCFLWSWVCMGGGRRCDIGDLLLILWQTVPGSSDCW